jgi:hypothetical protein
MNGKVTVRGEPILALAQRLHAIERAGREADELEARLIAAGVAPAAAARAAEKAFRSGALCMARTRAGTPCLCIGDGRGGRCDLHGGASTGPRTPEGKRRALAALERYRLTRT